MAFRPLRSHLRPHGLGLGLGLGLVKIAHPANGRRADLMAVTEAGRTALG